MEKTITVEEKIRRAEEIYNRRNGNKYIYPETKKQKGPSLAKRMTKQIIICILIYGIFYAVSNKEYLTSPEFLSQIEQKAEQNETTKKAYNWTKQQIQSCINQINEKNQTNQKDKANQGETTEEQPKEGQGESQNGEHKVEQETSQNNDQKEEQQTSNDENIGGAVEETAENEKTQEQKDVEKIKNTTNRGNNKLNIWMANTNNINCSKISYRSRHSGKNWDNNKICNRRKGCVSLVRRRLWQALQNTNRRLNNNICSL